MYFWGVSIRLHVIYLFGLIRLFYFYSYYSLEHVYHFCWQYILPLFRRWFANTREVSVSHLELSLMLSSACPGVCLYRCNWCKYTFFGEVWADIAAVDHFICTFHHQVRLGYSFRTGFWHFVPMVVACAVSFPCLSRTLSVTMTWGFTRSTFRTGRSSHTLISPPSPLRTFKRLTTCVKFWRIVWGVSLAFVIITVFVLADVYAARFWLQLFPVVYRCAVYFIPCFTCLGFICMWHSILTYTFLSLMRLMLFTPFIGVCFALGFRASMTASLFIFGFVSRVRVSLS